MSRRIPEGFPSYVVNRFVEMRKKELKRKKKKKAKNNNKGGYFHAWGWKPTTKSKKQAEYRRKLAEQYNERECKGCPAKPM